MCPDSASCILYWFQWEYQNDLKIYSVYFLKNRSNVLKYLSYRASINPIPAFYFYVNEQSHKFSRRLSSYFPHVVFVISVLGITRNYFSFIYMYYILLTPVTSGNQISRWFLLQLLEKLCFCLFLLLLFVC